MSTSLETLKGAACDAINANSGALHQLSDQIWSHPELAFEERFAHQVLTDFLEGYGFQMERSLILETAFRGTFTVGTGEGPCVAVLCEYDALPEIGHACGHNVIAEVGAGAAIGLIAALKNSTDKAINGKVVIIGSPAEEAGGGKIFEIEAELFREVDVAMMAHPWNITVAAADLGVLAEKLVDVTYTGKASHAAGFPWEGVNALDAAIMAYTNVSCMRQQMKPSWRVHGIITNGGAKPNIIPEEAALQFCVRAPKQKELKELESKVVACFQAAATATGCQLKLDWLPKPYKNMMTNQTLATLYEANAKHVGVAFDTDPETIASLAVSTDMGNVSHEVPSIHPWFHVGTDVMNHTRDFTKVIGDASAQPYALQQAKALAMTALDVLCQPQLCQTIRDQFKEDIKKEYS